MADTATVPLLANHRAKLAKAPSIDDAIETYMGTTGAGQLLKAVLLAFAWAFDAQQVFISVFTDAEPLWHCTGGDASCSSAAASPCALPAGAWAWDRPAVTSVVSEWSLKCAGPALVSLPASSFFVGCLAGGFLLTTLADSLLGRRKMLLTSIVSMSVAGVLTAFSPNVWAYAALRFVSGFARSMVGTCTMVLSTEFVGKKWRDTVCVAGFFCFTLGFLSLPALAYTSRDASWRNMYLWTSVPSLCYSILIYLLVQESPRWLLVRGRKQDAIEALQQIASLNGNSITSSFSMLHACTMQEDAAGSSGGDSVFATLHSMWQRPWALRRLAAIMTVSFGVGTVYYGMPLNVGNLGSNLYLSVMYNALAELPSSILCWLLMGRINRRSSVIGLTAAAGLCSLACVVIPQGAARMAAELVSFSATCTAFNVIMMYAIELFPTSVRNSAVGLVRQALVLGGVAAPVLVALGRDSSFLSFGVFGLLIGCFGMFAACLPETRGKTMSDTMDEEEQKEAAVANCTVDDMDTTSADLV
ncbi:organic cation/carnitine transporter 2-like [Lolium rigidum]|uniref:organic cation/carnitine transporter 2-like n=1 Tax=Lolium rigidum TaxID=89674 RepID=UPI001F5C243B|nr:organic cation/carnitine transporter 2-like [Lolium rigidum]